MRVNNGLLWAWCHNGLGRAGDGSIGERLVLIGTE